MAERKIKAGEFKARCLQLMDEVAETGTEVIITKRGIAVAKLVAVTAKPLGPKFGFYTALKRVDPRDDLFSAWDAETQAAFEDGLKRTADLINPPVRAKRKGRARS